MNNGIFSIVIYMNGQDMPMVLRDNDSERLMETYRVLKENGKAFSATLSDRTNFKVSVD